MQLVQNQLLPLLPRRSLTGPGRTAAIRQATDNIVQQSSIFLLSTGSTATACFVALFTIKYLRGRRAIFVRGSAPIRALLTKKVSSVSSLSENLGR